ncbi:adenosylcobinamide-GDP ribazoletransferase [Gudongella sp. DL1XJH-153]|uniref:adenosylcobinamide-GDP ribazoletransferase n=1 Tax=Gudongella sp. DL1XJH-153 TaxID=3409804 RepID=UPI003BB78EF5
MDGLILALQFFTRIPVGKEVSFNEKNIGRSLFFLPFIGIIIGCIAALPIIMLHSTSKMIASLLSILVIATFTGGLHLDGLADTFDGFLSGRKRDRVMEIMKDSTLGSFGALALIFLILSKFVAVYELPASAWIAIPLSLANARLVAGYVILAKKNAREDGLGVLFKSSVAGKNIIMAGIIYIGIIMFINPWYILPLAGSLVVGEAMTLWSYKKIDGLTGDVYGAIIELCEVASMIIFWGVTVWI